MKISWNDTHAIEQYLQGGGGPAQRAAFEARLACNPALRESLYWQGVTYRLVAQLGRQKLRSEIADVAQKVFTQPKYSAFRQGILHLFTK